MYGNWINTLRRVRSSSTYVLLSSVPHNLLVNRIMLRISAFAFLERTRLKLGTDIGIQGTSSSLVVHRLVPDLVP